MTRDDAINFLIDRPYEFGHMLGFTDLTELHNTWIRSMMFGSEDETLQGHRGSYKTTCLSITLALLIILLPTKRLFFVRKTDDDIKEIIKQVQNILKQPVTQVFVNAIWNVNLKLTKESATDIDTNLNIDVKGTPQLVGAGIGGSMTGKHFDRIFTDDIVNVKDRLSKAERDRTKMVYQELQNIKNRGGRIFNTGTPWHKDDCFSLMPNISRYDCYSTGLISEETLEAIKEGMVRSLFAANYELRHIASEDVIFDSPQVDFEPNLATQGYAHVDAAYGGEDWTALTICNRVKEDGHFVYYVYGRCWQKNVDDIKGEIASLYHQFMCGKMWDETNGDKGYLAKDLRALGVRVVAYHETQNKFLKIVTHLKGAWKYVRFTRGTDEEYINQICDYNENAEHDDCPDSLASLIRVYNGKADNSDYQSILLA